jgi:hypothetical protein
MSGTPGIEERKLKKPDLTLIDAAVGQKGHTSVPFQGNVSLIGPKFGHKPENYGLRKR